MLQTQRKENKTARGLLRTQSGTGFIYYSKGYDCLEDEPQNWIFQTA